MTTFRQTPTWTRAVDKPGRILRLLLLAAFLLGQGGCTLMLAGGLIHAIVTEVKSKKENPQKNEIVYLIKAEDREARRTYLVEVYVKSHCDLQNRLMLLYVDRLFLSYQEAKDVKVVMEDREGDGFIDAVIRRGTAFFPPVTCTSGEYILKKSRGDLRRGDPVFNVDMAPESPWYGFSERERLEDSPGPNAQRMNAFPFQQQFTRIAVAALKELNFTSWEDTAKRSRSPSP